MAISHQQGSQQKVWPVENFEANHEFGKDCDPDWKIWNRGKFGTDCGPDRKNFTLIPLILYPKIKIQKI